MTQANRSVRMGIDVGGTYTKCVAMDNVTHEIIGKNEVKTTHDAKEGVALGVVQSFENCMRENNIKPEDVVFVAHSTTQATNAFIEGDVAKVGIIGVAGGGLEGMLAKKQLRLDDVMPVIVEGVEEEYQSNFLRSMGCGYIQGYYYAKPMPVSEYEKIIRNQVKGIPEPFEEVKVKEDAAVLWTQDAKIQAIFDQVHFPSGVCTEDHGLRCHQTDLLSNCTSAQSQHCCSRLGI